jgi:hypothetical protein
MRPTKPTKETIEMKNQVEAAPVVEEQPREIVPDFIELGDGTAEGLYRVERSFFMKVRNGPGVSVPAGSIVILSQRTALEFFFANKIIPIGIEDGQDYEAIRDFRHTTAEGRYEDIEKGMQVRLTKDEALNLLKTGQVKPLFNLPLLPKRRF